MKFLRKTWTLFRYQVSSNDTTSLSYYLLLSVVPSLTLVLTMFSFFRIDALPLEELLLQYFTNDVTDRLISFVLQRHVSYISLFTIIMSIMISSRGFFKMNQVANRLYFVDQKSTLYIRNRFDSIGNTLLFFVSIVFLIFFIGFIPGLGLFLSSISSLPYAKYFYLFCLGFILLIIINLIVPSIRLKIRDVLVGSIFSSLGIVVLFYIYEIFFSLSNYTNLYGPLASVAMMLIVLNWMSNLIYLGMSMNACIYQIKKDKGGI